MSFALAVVTTVLIKAPATPPAGAYDLTTLAVARDELMLTSPDTSNDAFISRAITEGSAVIANYCDRVFPVESVQDQFFTHRRPWPQGVRNNAALLQLSRWPLVNFSSASLTGDTNGSATIGNVSSTTGLVVGALFFGPGVPAGTAIVSFDPIALTVTLSNAVPGAATGVAFTTGIQVVVVKTVGVSETLVPGTDYVVDAEIGALIRIDPRTGLAKSWHDVPTTVQYSAGYPVIPADLENAALRLLTFRFKARGRDPTLKSEITQAVGQTSYWFAVASQSGALPPEIESMVSNYRVPKFG